MSKTNKFKKARDQRRKNRKKQEKKDFFFRLTGVDLNTNAFYALQGNADFAQILDKADKAFIKSQNKDTRDRALNYLVRKFITIAN
jgi:hypothetical protein